jgi:hypothetical protein
MKYTGNQQADLQTINEKLNQEFNEYINSHVPEFMQQGYTTFTIWHKHIVANISKVPRAFNGLGGKLLHDFLITSLDKLTYKQINICLNASKYFDLLMFKTEKDYIQFLLIEDDLTELWNIDFKKIETRYKEKGQEYSNKLTAHYAAKENVQKYNKASHLSIN